MVHPVSGKYCVLGVGNTRYGTLPGRSSQSLHIEAISKAIADAGVEKNEIDGVLCKMPTSSPGMGYSLQIAQRLGIVPKVQGVLDQEGATCVSLIGYAMMCMELGQCSTAVISYGDNPRSRTNRYGAGGHSDAAIFGLFGAPASYALIARRHMYEFGTTHDQLGAIAVACHRHAALNPNAQSPEPISLGDYHESRWIAEPFHVYDCCLVSDGAAAIVVTSVEHAKSLGVRDPVRVLGIGQAHPSWDVPYREQLTTAGGKESSRQAFAMAGLSPSDVDVAELYDCFTIAALVTLEDYGFCKKGEGGPFCEDGRIELGGELPINTSGGLLAETGMPGMQLIVEGVRQLRAECGERQVEGAEVAAVSNQGGVMHTHSTLLLGK